MRSDSPDRISSRVVRMPCGHLAVWALERQNFTHLHLEPEMCQQLLTLLGLSRDWVASQVRDARADDQYQGWYFCLGALRKHGNTQYENLPSCR